MLQSALLNWTQFVIRNARKVLALLFALTAALGYYAIASFEMNSDTGQLIRQDTDWRRIHDDFVATFPQYDQNSMVVVSGERPDEVRQVARAVRDEIRRNDFYSIVYAPGVSEFADNHTLLYVELDTLDSVVSGLADAQPFLSAIQGEDTLRGIIELLEDAFTVEEELPPGLEQLSDTLSVAAEKSLAGDASPMSWRDELFQVDGTETYHQVVNVKGRQDFGVQLPNREIVEGLRAAVAHLEHPFKDKVRIRITGQVPLEHGEIESAMSSAQLAGVLALIMLIGVLALGVRSLRIVVATYLSMLMGLVWTAAFAMATVGQYNTISIIFLVIFIGLGVDFAIHLCLKYQEATERQSKEGAILEMSTRLGPAIMLCGVTSAIGFLSFTPTHYTGLAEMGIISGGGMIIAVIVSLTLIPAFFAVARKPVPPSPLPFGRALANLPARHHRQVTIATLGLLAVLTAIATRAEFDYSTLAIKNPDSEGMRTLRELIEDGEVTDYALVYVAPNMEEAQRVQGELTALPTVDEALIPNDYLPEDQDEKLYMLDDANLMLSGVFAGSREPEPITDRELAAQLAKLSGSIADRLRTDAPEDALADSLTRLAENLRALADAPEQARQIMHDLVVPPMQRELDWLERALATPPVTFDDLPADTRARLVDERGRTIVVITPAHDVVPVAALRKFTTDVLQVAPTATGRPVLDLGIGDIVLRAFAIAIGIAVSLIFVILLITLRSLAEATLVFIPLVMTAMLTLAFSVLIDLPLNMANVVVIPLIFGLGVDNGIHVVKRFHQATDVAELMRSSTPRAVFLSNLTTIGTFCALSLSTHQGIHSIGVLLTVALSALMVLTLISLPALLATFSRPAALTMEEAHG